MSGAPAPLRAGLIGYGLAGSVFHAPLISAIPGLEVASVVTSNPERRARAQADLPGVRVLDRAEALWELAGEHDLVVVASPNRTHVPLARAAIEAGLAVVVDKPLAPTAADGRALVDAATAARVPLTVFHNRRWDGDMLTVRRLLGEDAVGTVTRFESRFERWRPAVRPEAWRERGDPAEAGGLLFDLGSHLVDQALVLFGRPTHVYAEVERRRPGAAVDDDTFVALAHRDGVRSHLWMSTVAALPQARMRLLGLTGAYVKDGLDGQEDALRNGRRPGEPDWGREPPERWGRLARDDETTQIETDAGAYERFYAGVERWLREGAPPPVDPADAVVGLEILEAAFASAEAAGVVALRAG
ncbi:MAG TPA: Gfo/Idh/MocA family oxidoreductase [Solirubrobacteraceae bacterium]|nr:Gfo/Idh/MocA family oxidoreductase [Solirubrobacteraceae bacterium]